MPISLRLPTEIEAQIAGFSTRLGLSKSAVIVLSINEYLARHAHPSSLQIYEEVMREPQSPDTRANESTGKGGAAERRPRKLQVRAAIRKKHAQRSERAIHALPKPTPRPHRKADGLT